MINTFLFSFAILLSASSTLLTMQYTKHNQIFSTKLSGMLTCCMVTCGWEAMCCWGLRTPAAYLYWGMARTGAAVAEALAGRWLRAWVAEMRTEKNTHQNSINAVIQEQDMANGCVLKVEILTHALGGHHAWDLGVCGSGGTDGVEGLGPGSWWAHSIRHVLEVWRKRKQWSR